MNRDDIADDMEILFRKLTKAATEGDISVDALSVASILQHAARELRRGEFTAVPRHRHQWSTGLDHATGVYIVTCLVYGCPEQAEAVNAP